MSATLEVSKLSDWLNADAYCRVEREEHAIWGEVQGREAGGVGRGQRKRRARGTEGPTQGLGVRARAERTANIMYMFVTLEVSKLSGWLKACAFCRVEGRSMRYGARCGPGGGRAWGGGIASGMCTGKGRLKAWGPGHAHSAR
jgi:hypothetical protein